MKIVSYEIHIGDRFRAGTAKFIVSQPRTPCFKLALKFDRDEIIDEFLQSARPGFYLAVAKEGELAAGDAFRDPQPPRWKTFLISGMYCGPVVQMMSTK